MTTKRQPDCKHLHRRAFLRDGSLLLAAANVGVHAADAEDPSDALQIGLVTDMHYADKPSAGTRHYRETLTKLEEAAAAFAGVDLVVELGDFIDAADDVQTELQYLTRINRDFVALGPQQHYVLGNHCVYTLTKQEFLDGVEQPKSYYGFDAGGYHFVVLDACYRSDGQAYGRKNFKWTDPNIPAEQLEWLESDLKGTDRPTVVFVHQRLDVSNHYGVRNAPGVRKILQESNQVVAVFQGHSHKNDLRTIDGIHYCTLVAMVEGSGKQNSGYARLSLGAGGTIRVEGFRKQVDYDWST